MLVTSRWLTAVCASGVILAVGALSAEDTASKQDAAAAAKAEEAKKEEVKAEEAKKNVAKKEAPKSEETETEKPVDPFEVPKDATPKELMAFIQKLGRKTPPRLMPARIEHFTKFAESVMQATELALAAEDVDDDSAELALRFRFQALNLRRQLEVPGVDQVELELATKYSTDKREKLAQLAKERLLFAQLRGIKDLKADEQTALIDQALEFAKGDGKPSRRTIQVAMQVGNALEEAEQLELAATTYGKFSELLSTSDEPEIARYGVKLQGMGRRLKLTGSTLELDGELVDGKSFDWSQYQGKVVLVDFWATWCGPCIAELPNVRRNYDGYHTKGFEIVGVSLDKDLDRLRSFIKKNEIPWSNLFSTDEKNTGWDHPLAVKYGVMSIPFTMLVGKDGKVISMNVRGPELGKALAELLGEPDAEALKAASEAAEKEESESDSKKPEAGEKKPDTAEKKAE